MAGETKLRRVRFWSRGSGVMIGGAALLVVFGLTLALVLTGSLPLSRWLGRPTFRVEGIAVFASSSQRDTDCSTRRMAQALADFVGRVNSGDLEGLQSAFDPDMKWLSVSQDARGMGSESFGGRDGATAANYLADRHRMGERWTLDRLVIKERATWFDGRDITFKGTRSAQDLGTAPRKFQGKGAVSCPDGKIIVWSMSG